MPKKAQTAHGPDNNKRLAFLESRVALLISAATAVIARFAPDMKLAPKDENEDLVDVQIRLLNQVATVETPCDRRIAELEAQVAAGATDIARSDDATEGEIAAIARADAADAKVKELEAEVAELTTDVEEITSAKNALANQLAEAGQAPASSDTQPEPDTEEASAVRERPEAARDVGPEYGTYPIADLIKLKETDVDATFELAFSNGEFEILGIDPVAIAAACLVETDGRLKVNVPIQVRGRGAIEDVAGAGLLLAGEQVGYCVLDPAVKLHPGEERRFDHSLIFG
jgi:hypothetical protein